MEKIINGEVPHVRPLRKNDEFKEFYQKFTEMVELLKHKK